MPAQEIQTIPITWPFIVWGLDMVGLLKKGPGGFTHLLIVVDKFTKWIKAKPITNIHSEEAVKVFLNIIYRFGVPNYIITDHGTNFTRKKFLDFSNGYDIKIDWRTPLLAYLLKEVLLPKRTKAQRIARCAKTFIALDDELYKQSPSGVLMKCVPTDQGKQLLLEVHVGIYGHHMVPRSLVKKAFHLGFY